MSGLPMVTCPNCNTPGSLDLFIGHEGASEALRALAALHPSAVRMCMAAMRYVGLFSPKKQQMRMDRVAVLLRELRELIGSGRVEWQGVTHPAPLDYWINGMEAMLARRDAGKLDLPLDSHNYLRSVVAGAADKAASNAEKARENALAGRTPVGAPAPSGGVPPAAPPAQRSARPPRETFTALNEAIGRIAPTQSTPENPE